jgi:hypothetical protein
MNQILNIPEGISKIYINENTNSIIENVLYEIKLTGLVSNSEVKLYINTYLLKETIADNNGSCIIKSESTEYFRHTCYDHFYVEVRTENNDGKCYLDIRNMPEKDRRTLISAHKAMIYRITGHPCSKEQIKNVYYELKLDKVYGSYDEVISNQFN